VQGSGQVELNEESRELNEENLYTDQAPAGPYFLLKTDFLSNVTPINVDSEKEKEDIKEVINKNNEVVTISEEQNNVEVQTAIVDDSTETEVQTREMSEVSDKNGDGLIVENTTGTTTRKKGKSSKVVIKSAKKEPIIISEQSDPAKERERIIKQLLEGTTFFDKRLLTEDISLEDLEKLSTKSTILEKELEDLLKEYGVRYVHIPRLLDTVLELLDTKDAKNIITRLKDNIEVEILRKERGETGDYKHLNFLGNLPLLTLLNIMKEALTVNFNSPDFLAKFGDMLGAHLEKEYTNKDRSSQVYKLIGYIEDNLLTEC
jgi:hypothetical protein